MKKKSSIMRKYTAMLLTAALMLSLAPTLPGIGEAWAEPTEEQTTNTEGEAEAGVTGEGTPVADSTVSVPSVTAYATAEELKTEFKPNDEGTQAIGKLTFGKDGLTWYILGQDGGDGVKDISGKTENENTVIFSTKEIGSKVYHTSAFTSALTNMASSTYFTNSELGLMLETTVKYSGEQTEHIAKSDSYTGKLYALDTTDADGKTGAVGDTYITAGSDDSIKAPAENYWAGTTDFWLRSGVSSGSAYAFVAQSSGAVGSLNCNHDSRAVRPASAINLSSVLFASAATAASSDTAEGGAIAEGTAMKLRLDGKDYALGVVYLKEDDGVNTINVKRGTTANQVSLIVQGKSGTDDTSTDWYYSKVITNKDTETIKAKDIAEKAGVTLADTDLANCKIWLEMQDTDGGALAYAVEVTTHEHILGEYQRYDIGHWQECTECGEKFNMGSHEYESEEAQYCKTCGYDRKHKHAMLKVEEKAATCTEDGVKEHYECSNANCDVISKDSLGIVMLTKDDIVEPANGHKAAKYISDETKHWKVCENVNDGVTCGEVFAEGTHTFSGNKCTVCGYVSPDKEDNSDTSKRTNGTTYSDGSTANSDRSSTSSGNRSTTTVATAKVASNTSTAVNYPTDANGNAVGNWTKDAKGWSFGFNNGQSAKGTSSSDASGNTSESYLWVKINGKKFAFGSDGYLKTGWIQDSTGWYLCDEEKGMVNGWYQSPEDGYWYYLDDHTGALKTGWQQISGKQYCFAAEPAQRTYTFDAASSKWVYNNKLKLRPYGSLYVNTTTPDNRKVDANGAAY